MEKLWKLDLQNHLKISFFQSAMKIMLLYNVESWTLTKNMIDMPVHIEGCQGLYLVYHRKSRKQIRSSMENCKILQNQYKLEDWLIGWIWMRKEKLMSNLLFEFTQNKSRNIYYQYLLDYQFDTRPHSEG